MNDSRIKVAAVCGDQLRIYDRPSPRTGKRSLIVVRTCRSNGHALVEAREFDENQRRNAEHREAMRGMHG